MFEIVIILYSTLSPDYLSNPVLEGSTYILKITAGLRVVRVEQYLMYL